MIKYIDTHSSLFISRRWRWLVAPLSILLLCFVTVTPAESEAAVVNVAAVGDVAAESDSLTPPTPLEIARRLQEVYDRVDGFKADFTQVTTVPMSRRRREGAGTVSFVKPHKMRWEYLSPDYQVMVGDGREVRLYFSASGQMMIRDVDDYLDSDVTYAFFAGSGDIVRDFVVGESPAGLDIRPDQSLLRLTPRELHPQVDYLDLVVGENPFFIRRMEIVDHFGSVTTLSFTNIELNPDLPTDFHRFEPPPDTEILSATSGAL